MADPRFQSGFRPLIKDRFADTLRDQPQGGLSKVVGGLRPVSDISGGPGLPVPSRPAPSPLTEQLVTQPQSRLTAGDTNYTRNSTFTGPSSIPVQPAGLRQSAPESSAGSAAPAVQSVDVVRGEQPAAQYDFGLKNGYADPGGQGYNFASQADLKNIPQGKVAWLDANTYVDSNGTYNRIDVDGRIYQGGKTWQAEQTPAGVVFRDLRTGQTFNSALEAERGNPVDTLVGGAKADSLTAEAGLRNVQAQILPQEVASQSGLRAAQAQALQNAGLERQDTAGGFRDNFVNVKSFGGYDQTGGPITTEETYMRTEGGLRPVAQRSNPQIQRLQALRQEIINRGYSEERADDFLQNKYPDLY